MDAVPVFVVLLLCLSIVVEIESKTLHGKQTLTEILDYDSQDTAIDPLPGTKKDDIENALSVVRRKTSVPRLSKKEQFAVEYVDDSKPKSKITREFSSGNVKPNAIGGQTLYLSKEEASLVDQDVKSVLEYYGFQDNNESLTEGNSDLRIKEPVNKMKERMVEKSKVLNSVGNANVDKIMQVKKALKQQPKTPANQPQHILNLKSSLDATLAKQQLQHHQQNQYQKAPVTVTKPQTFKVHIKKILDPKLAKMGNKMGSQSSSNAKTSSKKNNWLRLQKDKLDLLQQKNLIHYNPLQVNNGKMLAAKNNFAKGISEKNPHQSSWLPMKENLNFFQDDNLQPSDQYQHSGVAKAAEEYMKMPNKEILKLVQNDAAQGPNASSSGNDPKASHGGVDIAAPDWLPIKEDVHGIQFDVSQEEKNKMATQTTQALQNNIRQDEKNKMASNTTQAMQNDINQDEKEKMTQQTVKPTQNDLTESQKNGRPNPVNVVQNGMPQTQKNRTEIQNDLRLKQTNDWLPIKETFHGLQLDMTQNDGMNNATNSSNTMKMIISKIKNGSSLVADSIETDSLNATGTMEYENITRNDNETNKIVNLEDSVGKNGEIQKNDITFKKKQYGAFSNESEVENLHDKLNFTTLPNENPKSSFKEIKNEKDVTKQVWSSRKVIHSHGHETQQMNSWGPWSTCSDSCGKNGLQIRTRECPLEQNDQPVCNGSTIEWKWCATVDVCPDSGVHIVKHNNNATYADFIIEGNTLPSASQWGSWSTCSKRCGIQSLRIRTRKCTGQRAKDTGVCVEPTMQWTWCKQVPCKEPQYPTMRFGPKKQGISASPSRTIPFHKDNIASNRLTIYTDNGLAFQDNCVVSPWSKWSMCSKSCGENSFKFRTRSCNCAYKHLCKSSTLQREHCKLTKCEGEENYGPWSSFSACTKPCGGGWRKRTRRCKHGKRHDCDQDLLIGVKVCNNHKCPKASNGAMVANVEPKSMCGFNPCAEFGCMDNRESKCLADASCDPVFFNVFGQIDEKCRGWERYETKNPTLFCGFDPCYGSKCQRAFGRCSVDLNCKPFVIGADGTAIDCNTIEYPF